MSDSSLCFGEGDRLSFWKQIHRRQTNNVSFVGACYWRFTKNSVMWPTADELRQAKHLAMWSNNPEIKISSCNKHACSFITQMGLTDWWWVLSWSNVLLTLKIISCHVIQHIDSHYNFLPLPVNDLHFWNLHNVKHLQYLVGEESI